MPTSTLGLTLPALYHPATIFGVHQTCLPELFEQRTPLIDLREAVAAGG